MRKELTVFVNTSDEDEIAISTTSSNVVVLVLPNGIKVGVNPEELQTALTELRIFKSIENSRNLIKTDCSVDLGVL